MINNNSSGQKEGNNHRKDNNNDNVYTFVKSVVSNTVIHSQFWKISGYRVGMLEVVGGVGNLAESNAATGGDSVHILTLIIPVSGVNRMCTYYVCIEFSVIFIHQTFYLPQISEYQYNVQLTTTSTNEYSVNLPYFPKFRRTNCRIY